VTEAGQNSERYVAPAWPLIMYDDDWEERLYFQLEPIGPRVWDHVRHSPVAGRLVAGVRQVAVGWHPVVPERAPSGRPRPTRA
jgi:hypothetical protein